MSEYRLEMRGVVKTFPGVKALDHAQLKLKPGNDTQAVKRQVRRILGDRFRVEDRYEQQADVFRIMEVEKLISYLFLTFILVIACFNIVGSLSMLILDKRDDVETLRHLGADDRLIARMAVKNGDKLKFRGALNDPMGIEYKGSDVSELK